jgi:hypothetical protein
MRKLELELQAPEKVLLLASRSEQESVRQGLVLEQKGLVLEQKGPVMGS